jgi:hypothetical protein
MELCVPGLWIYEISNLLVSAERRKRITSDQLSQAHELIDAVPRVTFDHETLLHASESPTSRVALDCPPTMPLMWSFATDYSAASRHSTDV